MRKPLLFLCAIALLGITAEVYASSAANSDAVPDNADQLFEAASPATEYPGEVIIGDYGISGVILPNHDLIVCGDNEYGQLGYKGKSLERFGKVMEDVRFFSSSTSCMAAVNTDGDLYIWGETDTFVTAADWTKPENVAGGIQECLLIYRDSLYMIDDHHDLYLLGQDFLDDDTISTIYEPERILEGVSHIDVGVSPFSYSVDDNALLLVMDNGDVYLLECQSDGFTEPKYEELLRRNSPVMGNVREAKIGKGFAAAVTYDNELYMWGDNYEGQLGQENIEESAVPVKVMDRVAHVALSDYTAYALTLDGDVYSWGANYGGALGRGIEDTGYTSPTPEIIMSDVVSIDAGWETALFLTAAGELYGVGDNASGHLGLPDENYYEPAYILNVTGDFAENQKYTPAFMQLNPEKDEVLYLEEDGKDLHISLSYEGLEEDFEKDDLTVEVMFSEGNNLYECDCECYQVIDDYKPLELYSSSDDHYGWTDLLPKNLFVDGEPNRNADNRGQMYVEGDRIDWYYTMEAFGFSFDDIHFVSVEFKDKDTDLGASFFCEEGELRYWDDQTICDKYIEIAQSYETRHMDLQADTVLDKWIEWKDKKTSLFEDGNPVEILDDRTLTANEIISKYNLIFNGIADENVEQYTLSGSYCPYDSGIHIEESMKDLPGKWGVDIGTRDFSVFGLTVGSCPSEVEAFIAYQEIENSNTRKVNEQPEYQYYSTRDWELTLIYEDGLVRQISYTPADSDRSSGKKA